MDDSINNALELFDNTFKVKTNKLLEKEFKIIEKQARKRLDPFTVNLMVTQTTNEPLDRLNYLCYQLRTVPRLRVYVFQKGNELPSQLENCKGSGSIIYIKSLNVGRAEHSHLEFIFGQEFDIADVNLFLKSEITSNIQDIVKSVQLVYDNLYKKEATRAHDDAVLKRNILNYKVKVKSTDTRPAVHLHDLFKIYGNLEARNKFNGNELHYMSYNYVKHSTFNKFIEDSFEDYILTIFPKFDLEKYKKRYKGRVLYSSKGEFLATHTAIKRMQGRHRNTLINIHTSLKFQKNPISAHFLERIWTFLFCMEE
eukprot:Pgem_evm1s18363